ncbi:ATP-binding protein [Microbacterium sp. Leaf179]|uniref:ATP-binding protein n=1 Tax=Microbacterium sp. Leaf179 TaxID=1736288 RepID=UPI0006FF6765|nr:ATP-binding protein [Microbacterium sp. Leaf179]KQR89234.1 hypothetical protein ASF96_05810 [Microbacterium sp. Leaf179]
MSVPTTADADLDIEALGVVVRMAIAGLPPCDRDLLGEAWSGARPAHLRSPVATVAPRPHFPFDATVADLTTQVTHAALSARRGRLWMVHAGAIADDRGRVILFSGRSGMGKTTLMSRLAREYAYVSDESVGVTAEGGVLAYRKPLSIIDDVARAKRQLSPRSLGLRDLPDAPLRLHAIVALDRLSDDAPPRLVELPVDEAVAALAPQCSYLGELTAPLQTLIGHIQATGGALGLRYREADEVLPLVRALFDTERAALPGATALNVPLARNNRHRTDVHPFRRTPVQDAVELDGRLALLTRAPDDQTTVHLLDGIGPTLWLAADGASFDELVTAAVDTHGPPEGDDARASVRQTLDSLLDVGLLTGPRHTDDHG